jgi:hypothetical protein
VILYRRLTDKSWSKLELTYNADQGNATSSAAGLAGDFEYFVQAVDATGNVALALNQGESYRWHADYKVYMPMAVR